MRFSTALISCLSVGLTTAAGLKLTFVDDDDHKVPGKSPLRLCDGSHDDDLLKIKNVDLIPNPPKAGEDLVIKASGDVKEQIEEGAYINLSVKYGLIRLINTKADLCEQIKNVDLECPIEKGDLAVIKTVELPNEIPPGKYTVFADVYTVDDRKITCLTATVQFSRDTTISLPWVDL